MIQTACLIGYGRLAHSLLPALHQADISIEQVIVRASEKAHVSAPFRIRQIRHATTIDADLVILAIQDSSITDVAQQVAPLLSKSQILVHCSGSASLDTLGKHPSRGVLYPLQTFTKDRVVPFDAPPVPLFVEGSSETVTEGLLHLAGKMSSVVHQMDSASRKRLHLGAVFCCNFVNHLFRITDELAGGIPFDVYEALIRNQIEQSLSLGPEAAQTGPAIRGDVATLTDHLAMLEDHPDWKNLYLAFSKQINPDLNIPDNHEDSHS